MAEKICIRKECNNPIPEGSLERRIYCSTSCKNRSTKAKLSRKKREQAKKDRIQAQLDFCKKFGLKSFSEKIERKEEIIV
jgi:hypothetical protein